MINVNIKRSAEILDLDLYPWTDLYLLRLFLLEHIDAVVTGNDWFLLRQNRIYQILSFNNSDSSTFLNLFIQLDRICLSELLSTVWTVLIINKLLLVASWTIQQDTVRGKCACNMSLLCFIMAILGISKLRSPKFTF